MTLDEFRQSIQGASPPPGARAELAALWHEAHGDWPRAHAIVQALRGKRAAAVHAYLHRREGDAGNADYWYARAGTARPDGPLEREWTALVQALLEEQ